MSNVIGPISQRMWLRMRALRKSINKMQKIDPSKYKTAIEKEKKLYNQSLMLYKDAA